MTWELSGAKRTERGNHRVGYSAPMRPLAGVETTAFGPGGPP